MAHLHGKSMFRNKHHGEWIITVILWAIVIFGVVWLLWAQNNLLLTKNYVYGTQNLPKSFVGYKIVQISDVCNSSLSDKVVDKVKKLDPDMIVLTGGYSDDNGKSNKTEKMVDKLCKIAPVYYIYSTSDEQGSLSNTNAEDITNKIIYFDPNNKDIEDFIKDNYGDTILKEADKGDEKSQEYIEYVSEKLDETANAQLVIMGIDNYDYEDGVYDAKERTYEMIKECEDIACKFALVGNFRYTGELAYTQLDTIFLGGTFGTNSLSEMYTKGSYGVIGTQVFISGGVGTKDGIRRIFNFPEISCITLSDGTIQQQNPLENFIGHFYKDVGTIFDNDGGFSEHIFTY